MATKKKILFFDDEPTISKSLVALLRLYDWDVKDVSTIKEFFEEITNHDYDVLIIDIMAPINAENSNYFSPKEIEKMDNGMSTGIVLAVKTWKMNNKKYKDLPVLFLSARSSDFKSTQNIFPGKCSFLGKPALIASINEELSNLLTSRRTDNSQNKKNDEKR